MLHILASLKLIGYIFCKKDIIPCSKNEEPDRAECTVAYELTLLPPQWPSCTFHISLWWLFPAIRSFIYFLIYQNKLSNEMLKHTGMLVVYLNINEQLIVVVVMSNMTTLLSQSQNLFFYYSSYYFNPILLCPPK